MKSGPAITPALLPKSPKHQPIVCIVSLFRGTNMTVPMAGGYPARFSVVLRPSLPLKAPISKVIAPSTVPSHFATRGIILKTNASSSHQLMVGSKTVPPGPSQGTPEASSQRACFLDTPTPIKHRAPRCDTTSGLCIHIPCQWSMAAIRREPAPRTTASSARPRTGSGTLEFSPATFRTVYAA